MPPRRNYYKPRLRRKYAQAGNGVLRDDNPKSRGLITNILEARGFTVITEGDPLEALVRATSVDFEIALIDYQMPGMMGTQLARELRRIDAELPVVVISGRDSLAPDELAYVNVHLGRGTRVDQLLETIEILANRGPHTLAKASSITCWHGST